MDATGTKGPRENPSNTPKEAPPASPQSPAETPGFREMLGMRKRLDDLRAEVKKVHDEHKEVPKRKAALKVTKGKINKMHAEVHEHIGKKPAAGRTPVETGDDAHEEWQKLRHDIDNLKKEVDRDMHLSGNRVNEALQQSGIAAGLRWLGSGLGTAGSYIAEGAIVTYEYAIKPIMDMFGYLKSSIGSSAKSGMASFFHLIGWETGAKWLEGTTASTDPFDNFCKNNIDPYKPLDVTINRSSNPKNDIDAMARLQGLFNRVPKSIAGAPAQAPVTYLTPTGNVAAAPNPGVSASSFYSLGLFINDAMRSIDKKEVTLHEIESKAGNLLEETKKTISILEEAESKISLEYANYQSLLDLYHQHIDSIKVPQAVPTLSSYMKEIMREQPADFLGFKKAARKYNDKPLPPAPMPIQANF